MRTLAEIDAATEALPDQYSILDEEALFREARRRRRRRRMAVTLIVAVLLGAAVAIGELASTGSGTTVSAAATPLLAACRPDRSCRLVSPPLAVGPTGALYVADVARDRILVRLPDGRFRVVAGDGKAGFSGDGGPAVRAELSGISDLASAPDGMLYIADSGRVRTVGRDGGSARSPATAAAARL